MSLELLYEIRKNKKAKCPDCEKGYFVARDDIPVEKQTHFTCNYCGEKYIINYNFKSQKP